MTIYIESVFNKTQKRVFDFSDNFDDRDFDVLTIPKSPTGTKIQMTGYTLDKIAKYDYIQPGVIKKRILEEFYSRFVTLNQQDKKFTINIVSIIDKYTNKEQISNKDIPNFNVKQFDNPNSLFEKFNLYYYIEKVDIEDSLFISAISVDHRTIKMDIVANENKPTGYKMIFLLLSDYFIGKIDFTRQNFTVTNTELKTIQHLFRKEVIETVK